VERELPGPVVMRGVMNGHAPVAEPGVRNGHAPAEPGVYNGHMPAAEPGVRNGHAPAAEPGVQHGPAAAATRDGSPAGGTPVPQPAGVPTDLATAMTQWENEQIDSPPRPRARRPESSGPHRGPAPTDPAVAEAGVQAWRRAVALHRRGDLGAAAQEYRRAEAAGVAEAAFNLGALLYAAGDLDGAQAAWGRCLRHRHARAATNLGALLARRGSLTDARRALALADEWGDPDARKLAQRLAARD
jgi:hypothetical protein